MVYGTWIYCFVAADMNVRTLGGTRCGAPYPRRVFLLIDEVFWSCIVLWLFRDIVLKLVARKLSGGQINTNFEKLRLAV
jgi:hypothetical protein